MSEKNTELSRRDVVRIAALLGFCGAWPVAATAIGPGMPQRGDKESIFQAVYPLMDPAGMVMTTCAGCLGGCALRAQHEVGVLAKVDGNPYSPRQHGDPVPRDLAHAATLRGATCARGQARVQNAHDPYRIVRVLRRDGPRGSGRFVTLEAEGALTELVDGATDRPGLEALRQASLGRRGGSPRILIVGDPRQQDRRVALDAFAAAYAGAAAVLGHPAPALAAATGRLLARPGWLAAPRWDRATAFVAWGADPTASGLDPVGTAWWMAEKSSAHTARVVAIDPRMSDAASRADLWVPVRPGTDRALAHWVARIWVEEGFVDAGRVPPEVLARPERQLEHQTGLGPQIVRSLASALRDAGPGLAIAVGGGVHDHAGGDATTQAILHLAALAGALGPGGAMEPAADPIPAVDGPRALIGALTGAERPDVVVLVGDAGVQDSVFENAVLQALASVPLVVAVATAMNRLAWQADFVIPDVTEFERVGIVTRHDGTSVVLPTIAPVPAAAGLGAGLGKGLEGLLQALLDRAATRVSLDDAVWAAIAREAGRAGLPGLGDADVGILGLALEDRAGELHRRDAATLSFLGRGWAPPAPASAPPAPLGWTSGESAAVEAPHAEAPVLVTYRESFGGQPDSDAQAWGARAVRQDNPLQVHPERLETLPGEPSDQVAVQGAVLRVKADHGLRPDCVALAVGYGQVCGFDGNMTVDGVAVPPAPTRCCGVAAGPLLGAERTVAITWAPPRRDPSVWDLLRPGGWPQLPSVERKHEGV